MKNLIEITAKEIKDNPFKLFGDDWALVSSGGKSFNTMTVSWGGVGVLWNKPVVTIYIRPQRYTNEFLKENELFTVSVLPNEYRSTLSFCGKYSGRDVDKIKETGLTPLFIDDTVSFEEARLILVCRKLYVSRIEKSGFIYNDIDTANYPKEDYHDIYIAEIVKAYTE